jgi:hypothetical protein
MRFPNGYVTFEMMREGEKLNLPEKWFDGTLDHRAPAYFSALPYADGTTPSPLGLAAAGVLNDYAALDAATTQVNALSSMGDAEFVAAVPAAALQIHSAVNEARSGSNAAAATLAQQVETALTWAGQRDADLAFALSSGDQAGATQARLDTQNALSTALGAAQITLQVFYGGSTAPTPPSPSSLPISVTGFTTTVVAAAQAVANALAADPTYCASVSQAGSAVNVAVHAFKAAWNATGAAPIPVNTGNYEQSTADVLTQVLGAAAPKACPTRQAPQPTQPSQPSPQPQPYVTPPQPAQPGLSLGEIAAASILGASLVGGAIYLATRP